MTTDPERQDLEEGQELINALYEVEILCSCVDELKKCNNCNELRRGRHPVAELLSEKCTNYAHEHLKDYPNADISIHGWRTRHLDACTGTRPKTVAETEAVGLELIELMRLNIVEEYEEVTGKTVGWAAFGREEGRTASTLFLAILRATTAVLVVEVKAGPGEICKCSSINLALGNHWFDCPEFREKS